MTDFRSRLLEAMANRNMTQAELAKATGLSKPRISQYVNGVYEAKQDALVRLADVLHVNIAWLMGYDVEAEVEPIDLTRLSSEQYKRLKSYYDYLINTNEEE